MKIQGRVAVITGAGSGIGAAMARRFMREGARAVVVCDRDRAAAEAVAGEIGGLAIAADVADEAQTFALIRTSEEAFGSIDLFCANAGVTARGGVEVPDAQWHHLWQVNVMAHVHAARALVPAMLARGHGHLLFTASAAGLLSQFDAPYAVTKHATVAFAEWLSITHGGSGLGISCLCPGGVDTPLFQAESAQRRALMGEHLLGPDEVADAVVRGLEAGDFLILPHPEVKELWQRKAADHDRWLRGMRRFHQHAGG